MDNLKTRKVHEWTREGKSRIDAKNLERREQADAKYRQKFLELGIIGFEYVRFEGKNHFRISCNRCGSEMLRGNDIFRDKATGFRCKVCHNGEIAYSELAEDALTYYSEGHSVAEVCEKFGVDKYQFKNWAKKRKVSSGRDLSEILSANAKIQAQQNAVRFENEFALKMLETGFAYLDGYKNRKSIVRLSCLTCGETFTGNAGNFKKYGATCPKCKAKEQAKLKEIREIEKEKERKAQQKERQKKKEQKEALRAIINPLGLSPYQLEREKRLDETDVCKVCGKTFVLRDYVNEAGLKYAQNPHYCSVACKEKNKREYEKEYKKRTGGDGNSRRRCRKYNSYYSGHKITWKTLAKLKGLKFDEIHCEICGRLCDPNDNSWGGHTGPTHPSIDHIIALAIGGGDVLENVRLACMECNSSLGGRTRRAKTTK